MYYVYKITNKVNGKCYVGITRNIEQRWNNHKGKTKIQNEKKPLPMAMKKYGLNNFVFEIVEEIECIKEARSKEIFYISEFKSLWTENGYNISPGGSIPDESQIENIRKRMIDKNPMSILRYNKGSFQKGHKPIFDEKRKANHRKSKLGTNNPMYGKSEASKHLNEKVYTCAHCGTVSNIGNFKRWHGDNCKKVV